MADSVRVDIDLEQQTNRYVRMIKRIDSILEDPVKTLCYAGREAVESNSKQVKFPVWIGRTELEYSRDNKLTQGLCCATLQMLSTIRRRFQWLDDNELLRDQELERWAASAFLPKPVNSDPDAPEAEEMRYFHECLDRLHSDTFGGLNPLTSAQIFRVLMGAGEDHAHEGIGFLAFFAMIWPLFRRVPDPLSIGAGIEPSPPTAYVTGKCVLTLDFLEQICTKRADILEGIARSLLRLHESLGSRHRFEQGLQTWEITSELDRLTLHFSRLASIAIARESFARCAEQIAAISGELHLTPPDDLSDIVAHVKDALVELGRKTTQALTQARAVTRCIDSEIISRLKPGGSLDELASGPYFMLFATDARNNPEYRPDLASAAEKALKVCQDAIQALEIAASACTGSKSDTLKDLADAFEIVATSNRTIAKITNECTRVPAEWCRRVMEREIAFASAANISDFDPAELASAIAVAAKMNLVSSTRQIRNAIQKLVFGAEEDGSWRLGHAFFSRDGLTGVRAPSADIVWTLVSTLYHRPEIKSADRALLRFVEWLDRTRRRYTVNGQVLAGWGVEHLRQSDRIHLSTTATTVNALVAIRGLIEHRIAELCKSRFTVLPLVSDLSHIDPVDLGLPHKHRLHRALSAMARDTSERGSEQDAPYSVVLHGPPGSSKTALTNAIGSDMWYLSIGSRLRSAKLIRITPADFTRMGEDRVDSEARLIFQMLSHIRGATILFDEIDDLLLQRSRNTTERPRFLDLVVPAMLNRLQDLRDACRRQELCFFFGTNYIDNIEPALVRPGRVDRHMAVVYPDHHSRLMLVARHLRPILALERASSAEKAIASWLDHWCASIAADTAGWSWNDIKRSLKGLGIRQVVQNALESAIGDRKTLPEYTDRKPPKRAKMSDTDFVVYSLHETSHRLQETLRIQARQITPPAYRARLSSQASRAELRREYIEFRLSMRTDFRDIDGILSAEASDFTGFGGNTANVVSEFMTELRAQLELRSV